MPESQAGNILLAHGGGPTPVINASLFGVVEQARQRIPNAKVLGAVGGLPGILGERFVNLSALNPQTLQSLRDAPGSAIGSSREELLGQNTANLLDICERHGVDQLLYNGGNGSMGTAQRIEQAARERGQGLQVVGIPKTIDNDLPQTDRTPGYASAARFAAQSVRDLGMDIGSLPTPVSIFETLGRYVGWIAAATALAQEGDDTAPHLIYLPEKPFVMERFLSDLDGVLRRLGWAVVVVTEGLYDEHGKRLYETNDPSRRDSQGRAVPGETSTFLAEAASKALGVRCRSEKPGLCGRACATLASTVDRADAQAVGRAAVDVLDNGQSGVMVTLGPYEPDGQVRTDQIALDQVAGQFRPLPPAFFEPNHPWITDAFQAYAQPLLGPPLLSYPHLPATAQ